MCMDEHLKEIEFQDRDQATNNSISSKILPFVSQSHLHTWTMPITVIK